MHFDFREESLKYHKLEHGAHYPRYQAWEFLWEYLHEVGPYHRAASPEHIEKTALHLGFYLANWGMLRGSSNLLYTNLGFFIDLIGHIDNKVNKAFWKLKLEDFQTIPDVAIPLFDSTVAAIEKFEGGSKAKVSWTSTLITKILLGIWGQCPAIDQYYKHGFKLFMQEKGNRLGSNCSGDYLQHLAMLASEHDWSLDGFESREKKLPYPPGKVLDMAFFHYGLSNWPSQ